MRPRPSEGDRSRVLQHWPYVIIFSISVLSTVRVTRAPMGTKATPTASLSAASVFPLGAQPFVVSAQITIQPTKMSIIDWPPPQKNSWEPRLHFLRLWSLWVYGLSERRRKARSDEPNGDRTGLCHLDEALHSAPDLKWTKTEEHFGEGGEEGGRSENWWENRCDGLVEKPVVMSL